MDPATLVGIGVALGAIVVSLVLEGGNIGSMFLLPPMILVIFGTIGAAVAGSILKDAMRLPKAIVQAMTAKVGDPAKNVQVIVSLAERARREGLLALDGEIAKIEDPFLKKALEMAVDGTDSDEIAEIMGAEVDAKKASDKVAAKLFTDMGGYSPTIGIIGTVLGLVHVLGSLSDTSSLGGKIAGAFIATLWGVMMANVFWLPMATRLKRISEVECEQMELAIEGVLAIQAGASPRLIARKLQSMMPDSQGPAKEVA
ncbi:MAG: motility protein A [Actinobacteria bacterium 69-20]|jgi:chemotaxis protein MotA|nr:motility protein A [Actinomycetota bacterium]OJV27841.1 MAG: motility protein A [Actinobacteria bacterium 69-20]